jgi:DNA-binding NtrC family response regulator
VNVRLLAATNRSMQEEVRAGRFREDLYYRINVMSLELPPLRARGGDIPLLVKHFLASDWKIEPDAIAALERYAWPGNIRQLANALARAKIMAEHQTIGLRDLPHEISGLAAGPACYTAPAASAANGAAAPHGNGMNPSNGSRVHVTSPAQLPGGARGPDTLALIERAHIMEILEREQGNKARAARALGINRRTLYRMLEKYEIRLGAS